MPEVQVLAIAAVIKRLPKVDLSAVASKWDVAETRTDLLHDIVYSTAELTQIRADLMTALVPERGPKIPGVSRDRDQIGQHISDKQVRREYDQVEADKKKIVGGQDFVQLAH